MHRASRNAYHLSVCRSACLNKQDHPRALSVLLEATSRHAAGLLFKCYCLHMHASWCIPTGMGQYQEAKEMITESYEGLRSALGDASQVAGESQYYLALMTLLAADTEDAVTQADPMLMQV